MNNKRLAKSFKRHKQPPRGEDIAKALNGCAGKKKLSKKVARAVTKKNRSGEVPIEGGWCMQAYKCKFCGYWHVGHNPGKYIRMKENS